MTDLETITYIAKLAGIGAVFGASMLTLDFLDYHGLIVNEKKNNYRFQQQGISRGDYQLEKPTWFNTLKETIPPFVSNYIEFLKHPIKNF